MINQIVIVTLLSYSIFFAGVIIYIVWNTPKRLPALKLVKCERHMGKFTDDPSGMICALCNEKIEY